MANFGWQHFRASLLLGAVIGLYTAAAQAAPMHSPVIFSRTGLMIHAGAVAAENPDIPARPKQARITMTAEMRPSSAFEDPGTYLTRPLGPTDAYLVPLPDRPLRTLRPSNVLSPVDVLVIDRQGVIRQIFPNLVLNALELPITLPENSAAVLYLASGSAQLLNIKPHYIVEHPLFAPPPQVIQ